MKLKSGYMIMYFFITTSLPAFSQTQGNDSAVIKFSEKTWDFGNVKQGESVTHKFTFTNTGNKPLVISEAVKGCSCTSVRWTTEPIMPGDTGAIWATFKSDIGYGHILKPIHIYSNSTSPQMDIYIKAELLNQKL